MRRRTRGIRKYRPRKRRRTTVRTVARMVKQIQKDTEVKYYDIDSNFTVGNTYANLEYSLFGMLQGTTHSTRIGNKVTYKGLALKFAVQWGAGMDQGYIRVVVVYDRKPAGALADWDDVFEGTSSTEGGMNRDNAGRFSKLFDKHFVYSANTKVSLFGGYIPLKNQIGDMSLGNSGNIVDFSKGSLILMACRSEFGMDELTKTAKVCFLTRVTYTDK